MTSLADLSWGELTDRLRALQIKAGEGDDAQRLAQDLRVHQVELEIQNRELQESQQRLEASQARYAELYDRAPVGYATLDRQGVILEINLTGAAILGRERDRLVGMPFVSLGVHDAGAFLSHLRACAKVRSSTMGDVSIDTPGGTRVLELTTTPNLSEDAWLTGFRTTMGDVTARRRTEAQLAVLDGERRLRVEADTASRMKDQFLGVVSHELRTPLNAVLGWVQILRSRPSEPELLARALDVMERNGQALARIVDDILDLSRIVTGKLHIERRTIDLADVVLSALEQARTSADARQVTLRESIERECAVLGDPQRLQQMVTNLVANAIKFAKVGGHVDVVLEGREGDIRLEVRDDGCGIDGADLPHVFEHFRQADSSPTRAHSGLGLGLAITHHIIEAHGGTIEARSEGRGRGAIFTVAFDRQSPCAAAHALRSKREADDRRARHSVAGLTVLCVDDEADALELTSLMLGSLGANVRTAGSAEEAMGLLEAFVPDVLVCDIAMPDRDGYDLIRWVRGMEPPLSRVPAIALTAYARAEEVACALRAGFTSHLAKPVEAWALVDTVLALAPSA